MILVSYGGGTNSTAMLIGFRNKGIIPDYIIFSDTGGEWPETYEHIEQMQSWCEDNDFPEITIVRYRDKNGNALVLEDECLKHKQLPSIAYGWKSCSQKYKMYAVDQFVRNNEEIQDFLKTGQKIKKFIGYDAGEPQRRDNARKYDRTDKRYENLYPLIDRWDWDREKCVEIIQSEGLKLPGKSSCFFCPSMKKREILDLKKNHPDLLDRALEMESNADLQSIKGLGRYYNWREFIENYESQFNLFDIIDQQFDDDESQEIPCGCYD